jgi:catechol 2,3-dioxygenase-like lactoylglutathione lyase family enzyme
MQVLGLHHAQITIPVGAEDEARRFYCGLLGLVEVDKPDSLAGRGGFWLMCGDRQIHVGVEDGVDRRATKAHLAYEVDNLDRFAVALAERDIGTDAGIPIPGLRRFEFRDPFGNRVELIERLDQH